MFQPCNFPNGIRAGRQDVAALKGEEISELFNRRMAVLAHILQRKLPDIGFVPFEVTIADEEQKEPAKKLAADELETLFKTALSTGRPAGQSDEQTEADKEVLKEPTEDKAVLQASQTEPLLVEVVGQKESGKTCLLLKLALQLGNRADVLVVFAQCPRHGGDKRVVYEVLQSEYALPVTKIQELQASNQDPRNPKPAMNF